MTENGMVWKRLPTDPGFASGIFARIAGIGVDSSERPSRYRWVVERTFA